MSCFESVFENLKVKPNKTYTLAFITKDGQILLGLKKRGFGEGKWNGFGGKTNSGETIANAAVRCVETR